MAEFTDPIKWWRNIHNGEVRCQPTIPHLYDWERVVRGVETGTWKVLKEAVLRPDDDYPRAAGLYTDSKPEPVKNLSGADMEHQKWWYTLPHAAQVSFLDAIGASFEVREDPHKPPVKGYRKLSKLELELVNKVKDHAELTRELITELKRVETPKMGGMGFLFDTHWVGIGEIHLQQGFMALVRAITRPETF